MLQVYLFCRKSLDFAFFHTKTAFFLTLGNVNDVGKLIQYVPVKTRIVLHRKVYFRTAAVAVLADHGFDIVLVDELSTLQPA